MAERVSTLPSHSLHISDLSLTPCSVDSVAEATYSGVPQIILPVWYDLYTLALRAEWLGNGIYANKGVEPNLSGPLLADAIVRTLRNHEGEEGHRIKIRAKELARICRRERGDRKAAEAIVAAAQGGIE
jgi:UDP:flavonoid glycosyltransferase YjiC (YdhE family)